MSAYVAPFLQSPRTYTTMQEIPGIGLVALSMTAMCQKCQHACDFIGLGPNATGFELRCQNPACGHRAAHHGTATDQVAKEVMRKVLAADQVFNPPKE